MLLPPLVGSARPSVVSVLPRLPVARIVGAEEKAWQPKCEGALVSRLVESTAETNASRYDIFVFGSRISLASMM